MTLVLSYLTQDFAIQVADRRLTTLDGRLRDDNANKATVFCGRMVFGYTGLAQIQLQRTDEWLTALLASANVRSLPDALRTVRDAATRHFQRIALTPSQRRHAFVGVGWTRSAVNEPLHPIVCRVSNFHDDAVGELSEARNEFTARYNIMGPSDRPALIPIGCGVSDERLRKLHCELATMGDPHEMAMALARTLRAVADRDATVGKNLLAVCLPKTVVEISRHEVQLLFGPLSSTTLGSIYLPAETGKVIQYGPNLACAGLGMVGAEAGPLP